MAEPPAIAATTPGRQKTFSLGAEAIVGKVGGVPETARGARLDFVVPPERASPAEGNLLIPDFLMTLEIFFEPLEMLPLVDIGGSRVGVAATFPALVSSSAVVPAIRKGLGNLVKHFMLTPQDLFAPSWNTGFPCVRLCHGFIKYSG